MKRMILLLALLCPVVLIAQTKMKTEISSQVGYEYNVPRNPSFYIDRGEEVDAAELLLSSPLSLTSLSFDLKRKWSKKHYFYLGTDASYKLYPTLMEASLLTTSFNPKYKYKLNKKWTLVQEAQFKLTRLNGELGENSLLTLSRPYTWYNLNSSVGYDISKTQQFSLVSGRDWKQYQNNGSSSLKYNGWHAGLAYKQKLSKGKLSQFDVSANWEKRAYTREGNGTAGFDDEIADIIAEGGGKINQFNLIYYNLGAGLKFKLNDKLTLRNSYGFSIRKSPSNNNLDYHQSKMSFSLNYSYKNATLKWRNSMYYRDYYLRKLDGENGATLKYIYLRTGLEWEQKLKERISFFATAAVTKRTSNHSDNARLINRSYLNGFGAIGIRLRF